MRGLERIEVDQTPSEIKTIHGQDGVRVFHLTRAAAGTNLVTGEKVKRSAHWKGDQLVLESTGGKGKAREVLSLVPARNQLIHALHLEMDLLKRPIDLRLVYDRIPVASFAPGK
jgi:3-deoxy-D-manno-octulosonate 8-phosphate phosphatase KdsC-like HAD superfamily phosphatase